MAARSRGRKWQEARRAARAARLSKFKATGRSRARPSSAILDRVAISEVVSSGNGVVEDAVRFINAKTTECGLRLLEIGRYVLDRFFGGDPDLAHFRGPKAASFRELAENPALELSKTMLCNAVNLAIQDTRLHQDSVPTSGHLPISHQLELLRVPDVTQKRRLIEEVRERDLSVRALRQRIDELAGGRPRLPAGPYGNGGGSWAVPKPIQLLARLDLDRIIAPGALDALEDSHREACVEVLQEAELRIQKMIRALRAAG